MRRYGRGDGRGGVIVAGGNYRGDALNQLNGPRNIFVDDDYSVYVGRFVEPSRDEMGEECERRRGRCRLPRVRGEIRPAIQSKWALRRSHRLNLRWR